MQSSIVVFKKYCLFSLNGSVFQMFTIVALHLKKLIKRQIVSFSVLTHVIRSVLCHPSAASVTHPLSVSLAEGGGGDTLT